MQNALSQDVSSTSAAPRLGTFRACPRAKPASKVLILWGRTAEHCSKHSSVAQTRAGRRLRRILIEDIQGSEIFMIDDTKKAADAADKKSAAPTSPAAPDKAKVASDTKDGASTHPAEQKPAMTPPPQ